MILIERTLHGKPYFPFSRRPEKMVFPKKLCWNMIFLALLGKMIFLFPKNMMLYLRQKMKDDLSQKNTWKYDIFFEPSEKMVFPRRAPPTHDLSCIIWRDGIFFPENIFFPFLRKYMEIWHFLCSRTGITSVPPRPCVKKNQRWSYPAKIHLRVIDVLDWHPTKSSINSLYFHGDLYGHFHALLSSEEK